MGISRRSQSQGRPGSTPPSENPPQGRQTPPNNPHSQQIHSLRTPRDTVHPAVLCCQPQQLHDVCQDTSFELPTQKLSEIPLKQRYGLSVKQPSIKQGNTTPRQQLSTHNHHLPGTLIVRHIPPALLALHHSAASPHHEEHQFTAPQLPPSPIRSTSTSGD